jgi:hypothetical protein
MAMIDTAHDDLYVACTGDSRAVAGIWEEDRAGNGHWRTEVLTEGLPFHLSYQKLTLRTKTRLGGTPMS